MPSNLIQTLETLVNLQRWNFLPRVEIWTEAENAAYVTHIAYTLGRFMGVQNEEMEKILKRILLQSLRKHYLSDIPRKTLDTLKQINPSYYEKLYSNAAKETLRLFPHSISDDVEKYLKTESLSEKEHTSELINNIIDYSQKKAALEECKTNSMVYSDYYGEIEKDIAEKIDGLKYSEEFNQCMEESGLYLSSIKKLKYLRRWNRINRNTETSVLAHTFIVSILSIVFSTIEDSYYFVKIYNHEKPRDFILVSIIRSLFHDVPEILTGDVITPVKSKINDLDNGLWEKVEEEFINTFRKEVPEKLKSDVEKYNLLKELNKAPFSVPSLVKDCDQIALVVECLMELESGNIIPEMENAFKSYLNTLQSSEWTSIREFTLRLALRNP